MRATKALFWSALAFAVMETIGPRPAFVKTAYAAAPVQMTRPAGTQRMTSHAVMPSARTDAAAESRA